MEVALPEDGGYIDGSFKLSSETLKMFADMPGEEGSAQAGTVQMEAAECCPYCEGENVFPNWDPCFMQFPPPDCLTELKSP